MAAATTTVSLTNFLIRDALDQVNGSCEFSEHTRQQRQKHPFSGMHAPFLTKYTQELALFNQHYSAFSHLLPKSLEMFQWQQTLKTPVRIRPLSECPVSLEASNTLLAVGGPPALMTATAGLETGRPVVYLNDDRKWPIANGSAWHVEEDADQEAPTTYTPVQFMKNQIIRSVIKRESYSEIEKTANYPWRTLDWIGYAKNPAQWLPAFKVALAFQWNNSKSGESRQKVLDTVAKQCLLNEKYYQELNQKVGGQLFLPDQGSIIVARTHDELNDLYTQQKNLAKEGRLLNILSREEVIKRFGFAPEGLAFGEKIHDKVMSPAYKELLSNYLKQQGGVVINGTLTTIYTDNQGKVVLLDMKHLISKSIIFLSGHWRCL